MGVGTTFLTSKNFDKLELLDVLKNSFESISLKDKDILEKIISEFKNDNYSLITPQQIHFFKISPKIQWAHYLIFRYKFTNFPKNHLDSEIPSHLLVEPVSACNIRCIMCFQVDESFSKNKEFMGNMNIDLFKKIIDDAEDIGIKAVTLSGRGEPTLNSKFGEMLEYCKGKFFDLKMNTNATRLNEKLMHQIVQSGVTDLVFSVDSYEKDEYEAIRVLGIFEDVVNNIKKFKKINDSYSNSKCATRVSGVKINKKQNIEKFTNFWKNYVDHVVMVEMSERWDTYNNPIENAGKQPCDFLWGEMYVWYDGKCNPCDVDYKSELQMGNIKENSIKEIWNSESYVKLRNLHLSGKRNERSPCDHCSNW
tara:strand:+ start:235 stop:1329 length:1095 start_codon:yes stop_codon:yes gene_type:complete